MSSQNPFRLLKERRFLPLFITQFFGAFNDNVYKNALVILFAFECAKGCEKYLFDVGTLINLCTCLFMLPYFLFSAFAGELADTMHKHQLTRYTKISELAICILIGIAFYSDHALFMIFILFLLGAQSAFFGPVKYGILPELLNEDELIAGNGLIEMATFIAIIMGTLAGGVLIGIDIFGEYWVTLLLIVCSLAGLYTAYKIPAVESFNTEHRVKFNPIQATWSTLKIGFYDKIIASCILCLSWFWMLGAVLLTQLPSYTLEYINGSESVVTTLLMTLSIGIGVGSIICERLCQGRIELGLVPLGAVGLTLFCCDLSMINFHRPDELVDISSFLKIKGSLHVIIDLLVLGIFSGIYTVPLYTCLQHKSKASERSRTIAANNITNSFCIVGASVLVIVLFQFDITIKELFFIIGLSTGLFSVYLFYWIPEFMVRFFAWVIIHLCYHVDKSQLSYLPKEGAAIIAANHVSVVDALILMAVSPRPIRFVVEQTTYDKPLLRYILRAAKAIPYPLAPDMALEREHALGQIAKALDDGQLLGIFPEGKPTQNGEIQNFLPIIDSILANSPVPVIPIALQGLWGSFFSNRYGSAMKHRPRRLLLSHIGVVSGYPIFPDQYSTSALEKTIKILRGGWR